MTALAKFFLYFGMAMAALYIIGGILLLIFGSRFLEMKAWMRTVFSLALIAYGIFRMKRYYSFKKNYE